MGCNFFKFQTFHDRSKLMKKLLFFFGYLIMGLFWTIYGPRLDLPTNLCVHLVILYDFAISEDDLCIFKKSDTLFQIPFSSDRVFRVSDISV